MISTRGRYAVRLMIELAEHAGETVPMHRIAAEQGISAKYLEKILPALVGAGLLRGTHGKGGGYRLAVSPDDCSVADILHASEGSMAPVACLEGGTVCCERSAKCKTIAMWQEYYKLSEDYFGNIKLSSLTTAGRGATDEGTATEA